MKKYDKQKGTKGIYNILCGINNRITNIQKMNTSDGDIFSIPY